MSIFYQVNKNKFLNYKFYNTLNLREHKQLLTCVHQKKLIATVTDKIYLQLVLFIWHLSENEKQQDAFLRIKKHTPYIIGINGSVSSGKSSLAYYIAELLKCLPHHPRVSILSTDNFIYSNKQLKKKKRMKEKGFPRSYNWKLLFASLQRLKENKHIAVNTYNQDISDIDPHQKTRIAKNQDFIIVEGINLLKPTCQEQLDRFMLSDYLDYSLYLTTPERNLKKWFHKRLTEKSKHWKKLGIKKNITRKNKRELKQFSNKIWNDYNKKNLVQFIHPYRYRANAIIVHDMKHRIQSLSFRL